MQVDKLASFSDSTVDLEEINGLRTVDSSYQSLSGSPGKFLTCLQSVCRTENENHRKYRLYKTLRSIKERSGAGITELHQNMN